MPLHRTTHQNARDEVARLEAEGETVTAIGSDDGGVYIATAPAKRNRKTGETETR